jgi:hypothetical protein
LSYWDIGNLFEHCFDVKLGKWIHLGFQFQKLVVGLGWKCNNIKNGQLFSFRIFVYTNFKTNYEMGLKMIGIMCVLKFSKFSCFSTISFEISKGYIYISNAFEVWIYMYCIQHDLNAVPLTMRYIKSLYWRIIFKTPNLKAYIKTNIQRRTLKANIKIQI